MPALSLSKYNHSKKIIETHETSMLKILSHNGMIKSEQHVTFIYNNINT
ncbi:MAG: hypothetical protein ACI9SJ_001306 [Flavobacteriaceae bacterium]|jgi:hypothetical protein